MSNKIKVGLTIIAALIVGFIGYRFMRDLPLFRQSVKAYTYFDKTDGLTAGNYIYVNGVKVGSVKGINLTSGDSVKVTLSFNLNVDVPKNSVANLESSGLLDGKNIVLDRGNSSENISYGDTLKGVYQGGAMETLKNKGKKISNDVSQSFKKLNNLLAQLNKVVNDTAQHNIDAMLKNLKKSSDQVALTLQRKRADIESSIDHTRRLLANVDTISTKNKPRIDSTFKHLNESLQNLKTLSGKFKDTNDQLNEVLTKINNGEGSLGKLVNDPSLYNNLDKMTGEMSDLIKNINEDPGKYLKNMHLIEVF